MIFFSTLENKALFISSKWLICFQLFFPRQRAVTSKRKLTHRPLKNCMNCFLLLLYYHLTCPPAVSYRVHQPQRTECSRKWDLVAGFSRLINLSKPSAKHTESASCLKQTAWRDKTYTITQTQVHASLNHINKWWCHLVRLRRLFSSKYGAASLREQHCFCCERDLDDVIAFYK